MIKTLITVMEGRLGSWLRYLYYRGKLKECRGRFASMAGFFIEGADKVSIGRNCGFNRGVYIVASESIEIGDDVIVGAYTVMRDADHSFKSGMPIKAQESRTEKITIGNDVWIGAHCCILRGARIGEGSVIGANSLVKKDIGENGVWAGSPVRKIKKR